MLRTNQAFLSFIEGIYQTQSPAKDIVIKQCAAGDFIFSQNTSSSKVCVIKQGIAKCFFTEENGKHYINEFLSEGEIVGEIEAIKNINCLCNVVAITDVFLYSINVAFFKRLLEKDLQLNNILLEIMATRIVNTSCKASSQQLFTVEVGVKTLLIIQNEQNIKFSKEDMAAYLGITIRSLNRILLKLA